MNEKIHHVKNENTSYVGEHHGDIMTHSTLASWWADESRSDTVEVSIVSTGIDLKENDSE